LIDKPNVYATAGAVEKMADLARLAFVMARETRLVSSGSQPDSLAQRLVDPRLPASTGRAEIGEHLGVQSDIHRNFGRVLLRPAHRSGRPDQAAALANLRPLEPFAVEMRGIVGINPFARGSFFSSA
jgi:hypothetical protein